MTTGIDSSINWIVRNEKTMQMSKSEWKLGLRCSLFVEEWRGVRLGYAPPQLFCYVFRCSVAIYQKLLHKFLSIIFYKLKKSWIRKFNINITSLI